MPGAQTQRRLRVLTLVDTLAPEGGGERFAADLAASLDRERFESSYCVTRWPYAGGDEPGDREAVAALEDAGVEVLGLGRSSRLQLRRWAPLMRELRSRPVDVLHSHKFGSNVWGSVLGSLARVPVIVSHEHTWSFEGNRPRVLLDRHVVGRLSDAVIAVSSEDRRRMIEIERIPPERVVFIPNGISGARPPVGTDVRRELGIAEDAPLIGAIGHLRAQKAYGVLIEAAAILREVDPRARVLIAGEGPERQGLAEMISRRGLGDTVRLLGRRDDAGDVIEALDVGVSSSDFEGAPLALLELMAAAKPIVATAVGGVPDIVSDGVTGRLVPPRDPRSLAEALAGLIADPGLAERMGAAARERQRGEFDFAVTVERVESLYEELFRRATANSPAVARSSSPSSR